MIKQIIFIFCLLISLSVFTFSVTRIFRYFKHTRPAFPVRDLKKRFRLMLEVAFGQTKIFRKPVVGFFHALVFWGFCVILFGSLEMVIDGACGTEKALTFSGPVYSLITASGDIFSGLVTISILIFLIRRLFFHIRRFEGSEMKPVSHQDAILALFLILFLMISLLGMNISYIACQKQTDQPVEGLFPLSMLLVGLFSGASAVTCFHVQEVFWWSHILLIFLFANILPYSKHFHVFMSVPNVFLSRLIPPGKISTMESITREVLLMLDPASLSSIANPDAPVERFGVKDVEDISWKNYLDALSCTECGRCTAACPANLTGKKLSPRKIMMNVRERMKEKGPGLLKTGHSYEDQRSLLRHYISEEELWACTTCNACVTECPININHPEIILNMRRYLVMEEASAPSGLKSVFHNMENNGAPWQFSQEDRLQWAKDLKLRIP